MILKISTIIFSRRKVMANNLIAQIFIVDFFKKIKLLRIFSLFNYPLLFAHPSLILRLSYIILHRYFLVCLV